MIASITWTFENVCAYDMSSCKCMRTRMCVHETCSRQVNHAHCALLVTTYSEAVTKKVKNSDNRTR